ncbi:hypothetical protein Taro_041567 [Colocasia esculenta]|uniref:TF-B3 domain-containing protein n=1 Tax=Colocasia esculenta TaxID=4460 RepID=A0A843WTY3_COLES|nr:hypothetical protein [Colocasia esculenta]
MRVPHAEAPALLHQNGSRSRRWLAAPGSPAGPRTMGMCFGRESPLHRLPTKLNCELGGLGYFSLPQVQRQFSCGCSLGSSSGWPAENSIGEVTAGSCLRVGGAREDHGQKESGTEATPLRQGPAGRLLPAIPPKFEKNFYGEHVAKAILEGPTGGIWPVELQRTSEGIYLSQGWQNFVEGNTLQGLELLLFRYEGSMHFNVSVFHTSACERGCLLTDEGSETCKTKGLRKRGRPRKYPRKFGRHVRAERMIRSEEPNSRNSSGCLPSPQIDVEIKVEEGELPIATIGLLPSLPGTFGSSPGALAITRRGHRPTSGEGSRTAAPSKRSPRRRTVTGYLSKRRPVSLYERERAYEAAQSFTSTFPFFISCMKVSSVYKVFLLMVPSSFAKAHLPRSRIDLLLEDPAGRAWPVRYIPDGESKLSGGWIAFAYGNNLEEGDLCVFELVRPLELRVHIFRVVEEITPLVRTCWPCSS